MLHLTVEQARGFYAEHDGKPFFDGLVEFMTSGPIVVSVLESENAVQRHRDLLGATNPANALAGTLRAETMLTASPRTVLTVPTPLSQRRAKSPISLVKVRFARALANLLRLSRRRCVGRIRIYPGHIVFYDGDARTAAFLDAKSFGDELAIYILFSLMLRANVASLRQTLYNATPRKSRSLAGAFLFNPPRATTCNNEAGKIMSELVNTSEVVIPAVPNKMEKLTCWI